MMLKAKLDTRAGTDRIQDGTMPKFMAQMMEMLKPEAAYFGPDGGVRTAFVVFDMADPSQLPALTEPLYANLSAQVEIFPVMNREDLERGLSDMAGAAQM